MHDSDESIERMLRADALRPQDEGFTQRVLQGLPRRSRVRISSDTRRSLVAATRVGVAFALLAVAQLWYVEGPGGVDALFAILLVVAPAFAAISRVCGPLIPRSVLLFVRRGGR
jgi:hypothetical protein